MQVCSPLSMALLSGKVSRHFQFVMSCPKSSILVPEIRNRRDDEGAKSQRVVAEDKDTSSGFASPSNATQSTRLAGEATLLLIGLTVMTAGGRILAITRVLNRS